MGFTFEIADDAVLKVVGVGTAVHAATFALAPKNAHKFHYAESIPFDEVTARQYGFALGALAAQNLAVGLSENSKEAKKNALKASGLTWLVGASLLAYNGHEGNSGQSKEMMYGAAAGHALLGALCLWRGFDSEEKWSKEL